MIGNFFTKLRLVLKDEKLVKKILFILVALLIFRLLANIPIPGINHLALEQFLNDTQFL